MAHLLIVDDDATIRHLIRRTLERSGHSMVEAENGREAIRNLTQKRADLVLLDLNMPEMEGIETVQEIRRTFPSTKIIVISGVEAVYLKGSQLLGADAAIRKPFHPEELRETVARVLEAPDRTETPVARARPS
ncbi:MAG: response regulator [Longimicrobiales bacterium]